ncbi:hypothetical protein Tco_0823804 [Tanacetum coccineum]|uniref:Uncharacterized protein n=1 Tax=Tanacetum coccineum TaxID=301880 RepID=A0ABQ5AIY2_9ASTR
MAIYMRLEDLRTERESGRVGGPCHCWLGERTVSPPAPGLHVPSLVIEDLCTRIGNLEYRHGKLVKKVIHVSNSEVVDGITIGKISPRVSAIEGQVQVMASQMVQAMDRLDQVGAQRDVQIQQLARLGFLRDDRTVIAH